MPLLLISAMFNSMAGFVGPLLSAKFDSRTLAKSALVGIVVNVVLNILLTIMFGTIGITIATAIASFVIYYCREKATNKLLRSSQFYKICFSWIILVAIAINIIENSLVNYIICFGLLLIVFFIYKKIICDGWIFLKKILFKGRKINE